MSKNASVYTSHLGGPPEEAVAGTLIISKLSISTQPGGTRITEGSTMSEKSNDTPTGDPEEQGAEEAGKLEEQTAGGYGGPGTEDEIAPDFEVDNNGGSGT
jgi:hypothetical protein